MKLENTALLETIFALKQNFAEGLAPTPKVFSGIEVAPFKDNANAAISISTDFEMCWAWRGSGLEIAEQKATEERRNVPLILALLEENSIPITWATVGHLFLENCARSTFGLGHENMPRPLATDWGGDWYLHDPCSNLQTDPLWYAPDLIRQIMNSRIPHEVGTHSFSHINFSTLRATPELVRRELESCIEAMQPFGLRPRSLVFPHNIMEYSCLPVLEEAGILAVRHRDARIRLSYPERTSAGVYRIYESMNLRVTKHYDYAQKAKIFIQKAMERRAVYSIWFHPSDPWQLFDAEFRRILQYIDSEQRSGRLWVATMQDLAAYCEAREQLELKAVRQGDILNVSISTKLDTARYGTPVVSILIPAPSKPKSIWLESTDGKGTAVGFKLVSGDRSERILLNIPTNAKSLQVSF